MGGIALSRANKALNKIRFSKNSIVLLGDSITALNGYTDSGTSIRAQSEGYFNWCNIFMNQTFNVVMNSGHSSKRTDEIYHFIDTDVIPYNPEYCLVMAGINDLLQSIPTATITSNLQAIYTKLLNANIQIIVCPILPCGGITVAGGIASQAAVNRWIKNYALANNGVYYIDIDKYFVDGSTGNPLSGYCYDTVTHPNTKGAYYLGKALYERLNGLFNSMPNMSICNKTSSALNSNPMMLGNSTGMATGYTLTDNGTVTPTKVARTAPDISGETQRLTCSAVAGSVAYINPSNFYVTPGKIISLLIEFEISSCVSFKTLYSSLTIRNNASATIYICESMYDSHAATMTLDSGFKGIIKTPPVVVPAAGYRAGANLFFNLEGVLDIKRFEVLELT